MKTICRSSRPEVFCKKDVLINFAKFTGKHQLQVSCLIKLQAQGLYRPIKKETLTQVLSCDFCEILRTPFLTEHLRWMLLMFLQFLHHQIKRLHYKSNLQFLIMIYFLRKTGEKWFYSLPKFFIISSIVDFKKYSLYLQNIPFQFSSKD